MSHLFSTTLNCLLLLTLNWRSRPNVSTHAFSTRKLLTGKKREFVCSLCNETDGIVPLEDVIAKAATNRPDIVDPAALRTGRFDRLIYVPEPAEAARLEIFKIHTRKMPLSKDVDMKEHRSIS